MARIRDRTEDFKDMVRQTALAWGYNEVCLIFENLWDVSVFNEAVSFSMWTYGGGNWLYEKILHTWGSCVYTYIQ